MDRFKNILFVCSGQKSDAFALARAIALAETNGSALSLLAAYEPVPKPGKLFLSKSKLEQIEAALEEKVRFEVDELLQNASVPLAQKIIIPASSPFETIYQVLKHDFDLVIKIKENYGVQMPLASVDMRLLRKCPCPVWIINGGKRKNFSRILAAIDPNPTEVERVKLQYEILKLASSLARRENAQLDVLYAWKFFAEGTLKGPRYNMSDAEIAEMEAQEKKLHKAWLEEAVEPFQQPENRFKGHLIKGAGSKVILDFIKQKHSDLLVMGTVARTGIPGLIIGNTAESVLGKARCSILTIKPSGFKSPVSL